MLRTKEATKGVSGIVTMAANRVGRRPASRQRKGHSRQDENQGELNNTTCCFFFQGKMKLSMISN